jgi:hypothetical protein
MSSDGTVDKDWAAEMIRLKKEFFGSLGCRLIRKH